MTKLILKFTLECHDYSSSVSHGSKVESGKGIDLPNFDSTAEHVSFEW